MPTLAYANAPADFSSDRDVWLARYRAVRALSETLAEPLSPEDQQVQTMDDVSPTKWHLAHVTWFFETFLLTPSLPGYRPFDPDYGYLFNSYYEAVGPRHARPRRGFLSRPPLTDILSYRAHVDEAMARLIAEAGGKTWRKVAPLIELGLNHEQQHQELLLTDIKHVLSCNPLAPAYRERAAAPEGDAAPVAWCGVESGIYWVGHDGEAFTFDNESPRHRVLIEDFEIASRPVTNGEFLAFIEDGGYRTAAHWLSDGWATIGAEAWDAPFYWRRGDGVWREFTLAGEVAIDPAAPVCHLSYYEAAAYAAWAGARLPTEAEWEVAAIRYGAMDQEADANLLVSGRLHPTASGSAGSDRPAQMIGDVWEWTGSDYAPYRGFHPAEGAVGEYNGKFMCNQMVLRGGSCATPPGHIRTTYRNFFYPPQRWQFMGVRLARDA